MGAERARWGVGRKLLLQVALLPFLLILVECGYRGLKRVREEPHDPDRTRAELLAIADKVALPLVAFNAGREDGGEHQDLTTRRIPSPFYGWEYENRFAYFTRTVTYFTTPEAEAAFDILILGGSVAAGFGVYGGDRLSANLARDARFEGRDILIQNAGIGGFKQPQQLNLLAYLLALGWKPDAVINVDGFNEVALGNANAVAGAHPLHPSIDHWGHLLAFGRADDAMLDAMWRLRESRRRPRRLAEQYAASPWLQRSAFLTDLTDFRVRMARREYWKANESYSAALQVLGASAHLFGPPGPTDLEDASEASVRCWFESSRSLQAICDAAGIHYVHVLQPTLHDPGSKPLTQGEIRGGRADRAWAEAVPHGYPLLREAGQRLREIGVNHVAGSMVFEDVEEPVYVDACHFQETGNRILADHVAERFLATLAE